MAKRRERRHLNKLLNNGGVATEGEVKIQHDITCSICLQTVDEECRCCCYTLDCGHSFHPDCLLKWYNKSYRHEAQFIIPWKDLRLQFFPQGTNCMKCPMCRVDYTMELAIDEDTGKVGQKDTSMKRILGKINMLFRENDEQGPRSMTHYVTDIDTFKLFSPVIDIEDDNGEPMTLYMRL